MPCANILWLSAVVSDLHPYKDHHDGPASTHVIQHEHACRFSFSRLAVLGSGEKDTNIGKDVIELTANLQESSF